MIDAVQLLFNHLGDGFFDRVGISAGEGCRYHDLRGRDLRIRLDAQIKEAGEACHRDQDGEHPREYRALDEELRHARFSGLLA